jgi:O-antigen/teichoic acid export membrane protein
MGGAAAVAVVPFGIGLLRARVRPRLLHRVWHRHWLIARWLVLMILVATGQEQIIWIGVAVGLGDSAVGALRAGQYLLGITHFVMMAVENFLPRQAAEEHRIGGVAALKAYLVHQTVLLGCVTGLLILAVALPARFWLTTVFGPAFGDYAPLLWIYSVTYAVIFLRTIWVYYLRTIEDTRTLFRSFLVSSVIAVVCAWPAIALFGITGAASVVLGAHVVCMLCVMVAVRRHLRAAGLSGLPASAAARAG